MINNLISLLSTWIIPLLIFFTLVYAYKNKVPVFDTFVEGAREGFDTSVKLIPFLVAMLVGISLFRESGAMDFLALRLKPLFVFFGIPLDVLPLAIMRPVSGSSALAIATEIIQDKGPDSFVGRLVSTMQGSTDTTLFVITVYFGSVGVWRTRHALPVGLIADLMGFVSALVVCKMFFG